MLNKIIGAIKNLAWGTNKRKVWSIIIVVLLIASVVFALTFQVPPPHVALSGEPIFSTGPDWLTNSVLMTIIVDIFLILLALITRFSLKEVPGGLQNAMEGLIEALYGLAESGQRGEWRVLELPDPVEEFADEGPAGRRIQPAGA